MTELTREEKAQAGAEYLDEHEPGWHEHISLEHFNIKYPDECVLGQLAFWDENYEEAGRRLGINDNKKMDALGLYVDNMNPEVFNPEYERLNEEWRKLIQARTT